MLNNPTSKVNSGTNDLNATLARIGQANQRSVLLQSRPAYLRKHGGLGAMAKSPSPSLTPRPETKITSQAARELLAERKAELGGLMSSVLAQLAGPIKQ